jgi:galactose-1-phosphate uridylyltransferase
MFDEDYRRSFVKLTDLSPHPHYSSAQRRPADCGGSILSTTISQGGRHFAMERRRLKFGVHQGLEDVTGY